MIQKIDKIRRSFLWAKPSKGKRGISLTNWEEACISKREGGMGIIDLNFFNIALLLRWWWKALADENFLWSLTIRQLRRRGNSRNGPLIWMVNGCFFWNQWQSIKGFFNMCTTWHIWDGKSIAFWFDSWNDQSGRVGNGYGFSKPSISLRDAWHRIHALDPNLVINREI